MIAIVLVLCLLSVIWLVRLVRSDGLGVVEPPRNHYDETVGR